MDLGSLYSTIFPESSKERAFEKEPRCWGVTKRRLVLTHTLDQLWIGEPCGLRIWVWNSDMEGSWLRVFQKQRWPCESTSLPGHREMRKSSQFSSFLQGVEVSWERQSATQRDPRSERDIEMVSARCQQGDIEDQWQVRHSCILDLNENYPKVPSSIMLSSSKNEVQVQLHTFKQVSVFAPFSVFWTVKVRQTQNNTASF